MSLEKWECFLHILVSYLQKVQKVQGQKVVWSIRSCFSPSYPKTPLYKYLGHLQSLHCGFFCLISPWALWGGSFRYLHKLWAGAVTSQCIILFSFNFHLFCTFSHDDAHILSGLVINERKEIAQGD